MVDLNLVKSLFFKIGFNTFIQILGKGISVLLGFITVGLLTRYLGQEGFGNFNLAFAYLSIFSIIADSGLQLTIVRELSKKENLPKKIYGTYFWIKLFLVTFSTLLAIFCLLFFPYSKFLKIGIIITSLGTAIGVMNTYGTVIFQSNLRLDLVTLVDVIVKIITTCFVVLFVFFKLSFYSILSTILIGNLTGAFLILLLLKKFISFNLDFELNLAKKLIIKSLPVGIISFLATLYFKIDTLLLSLYRGVEEIGIYSLAYRVLENLLMLWGFYMATVYPLLANLIKTKKNKEVKNLWHKSLLLAVGSGILVIIIGFTFAPLAINILGGPKFRHSTIALRILLFSVPLFFFNNLFYYFFLIKVKMKILLAVISASLVINLILNLIFIPKYGYLAASYNTLVTELCLLFMYIIIFQNFSSKDKIYE